MLLDRSESTGMSNAGQLGTLTSLSPCYLCLTRQSTLNRTIYTGKLKDSFDHKTSIEAEPWVA
jgi:hypothetical protein